MSCDGVSPRGENQPITPHAILPHITTTSAIRPRRRPSLRRRRLLAWRALLPKAGVDLKSHIGHACALGGAIRTGCCRNCAEHFDAGLRQRQDKSRGLCGTCFDQQGNIGQTRLNKAADNIIKAQHATFEDQTGTVLGQRTGQIDNSPVTGCQRIKRGHDCFARLAPRATLITSNVWLQTANCANAGCGAKLPSPATLARDSMILRCTGYPDTYLPQLTGTPCGSISRIVVNDAASCVVAGADAPICMQSLTASSRTAIQFVTVSVYKIFQFARLGVGKRARAEEILDTWLSGRGDDAMKLASDRKSHRGGVLICAKAFCPFSRSLSNPMYRCLSCRWMVSRRLRVLLSCTVRRLRWVLAVCRMYWRLPPRPLKPVRNIRLQLRRSTVIRLPDCLSRKAKQARMMGMALILQHPKPWKAQEREQLAALEPEESAAPEPVEPEALEPEPEPEQLAALEPETPEALEPVAATAPEVELETIEPVAPVALDEPDDGPLIPETVTALPSLQALTPVAPIGTAGLITTPVPSAAETVTRVPLEAETILPAAATGTVVAAVGRRPNVTPPTPKAAAPAPSAQDLAIGDLLRRIQTAATDPCLLALPRRDGEDGVGLALIASSDAAMARFSDSGADRRG
ncbi:hypothetical protein GQR58_030021 [Nymphon striatum]|nr:hypothetical protein GQR58_030021 [Nymphon striatum]